MSELWSAIERELGARSELAADPWSHRPVASVSLTEAQRRRLADVTDACEVAADGPAVGDSPCFRVPH
jgi:hypothetical protein